MRDIRTSRLPYSAHLAVGFLIIGLFGCGSEPVREPEPVPEPEVVVQPPVVPAKTVLTLPPSTFSDQFLRADTLLTDHQWMAASEVLETIPDNGRSPSDAVYITYLEARIDYIRGDQKAALEKLDTLNYTGINPAQRYRILNLRRYITGLSGDYLESARLGDQVLRMAPTTDAPALRRSIWHDLQRLDDEQLELAATAATDPGWQGWLELALLTRAPVAAEQSSAPGGKSPARRTCLPAQRTAGRGNRGTDPAPERPIGTSRQSGPRRLPGQLLCLARKWRPPIRPAGA
jgi:hypothetical protein